MRVTFSWVFSSARYLTQHLTCKIAVCWVNVERIYFWTGQTFCYWAIPVDCLYPNFIWFTLSQKDLFFALTFRSVCLSQASWHCSLFPPLLITNVPWPVISGSICLTVWHSWGCFGATAYLAHYLFMNIIWENECNPLNVHFLLSPPLSSRAAMSKIASRSPAGSHY